MPLPFSPVELRARIFTTTGMFLFELARANPSFNYLGVDIKDEYIRRALSRMESEGISEQGKHPLHHPFNRSHILFA